MGANRSVMVLVFIWTLRMFQAQPRYSTYFHTWPLIPVAGNCIVAVAIAVLLWVTLEKLYWALMDVSRTDFHSCSKLDSSGPLRSRENSLALANRCRRADRQPFCCSPWVNRNLRFCAGKN